MEDEIALLKYTIEADKEAYEKMFAEVTEKA